MADDRVVEKFRLLGDLPGGAMPIASLTMLWYLGEDGSPAFVSKLDGEIRISQTVGDLTALIHEYLHDDEGRWT